MIRYAKEEDISALAALEEELFPSHPWTAKEFLYEINENPFAILLIDERDHQIVGYIDLWIEYERAEIANIAVTKKRQSEGIGNHLLHIAINTAKEYGCENVSLEVRSSNVRAKGLYEKNGFIVAALRKQYYEDGEDALLMVKPIGGLKEYDEDTCD